MKRLICILIFIITGAASVCGQTDKAFFYQSLAWSPDGKSLGVTAMSDYDEKTDDYRTGIFIAGANGANIQKIL